QSGKPVPAGTAKQLAEPIRAAAAEQSEHSWNIHIARANTYLDFVFIGLYWSVFVLLARASGSGLYKAVIVLISLAALFDLAENALLLAALRQLSEALFKPATLSFTPSATVSAIKWAFFALASAVLGIAQIKTSTSSRH